MTASTPSSGRGMSGSAKPTGMSGTGARHSPRSAGTRRCTSIPDRDMDVDRFMDSCCGLAESAGLKLAALDAPDRVARNRDVMDSDLRRLAGLAKDLGIAVAIPMDRNRPLERFRDRGRIPRPVLADVMCGHRVPALGYRAHSAAHRIRRHGRRAGEGPAHRGEAPVAHVGGVCA